MNIQDFIRPELLVLIPVCWGLGLMLKSTPINNRWIPLILGVCSIMLAILYIIAAGGESIATGIFSGFTQGVVCWLAAWLSYEKIIKKSGGE